MDLTPRPDWDTTEAQSEAGSFDSGSSESDESSSPASPEPDLVPYDYLEPPSGPRPISSNTFHGLTYTIGPAPDRQSQCTICMEVIQKDAQTCAHLHINDQNDYSHLDKAELAASCCRNAWHEECFVEWAKQILDRGDDDEPITCPMCRRVMQDRIIFGPQDIAEMLDDLLDTFTGNAHEAEQIWLDVVGYDQVPELTDSVTESDEMDLDEMDGIERFSGW